MPELTISIGDRLTDYRDFDLDVRRVDSGGFGVVAMGPDRIQDGRWIALKTLRPEVLARVPHMRERFIREAIVWLSVWPHRHLLPAHGVVTIDDQPFLALDYAEKGNLRDALLRDDLEDRATFELLWALAIAIGLDVLHTPDPDFLRPIPLVHRDLKPENVLIGEHGHAMITDFGLAKLVDELADDTALLTQLDPTDDGNPISSRRYRTAHGVALGTPAYMAPEQWEDATSAGPPADMYAYGLILSELFARRHGLLDLDGRYSQEAWHRAHMRQAPRPIWEAGYVQMKELEDLYQACLAKDPADRPAARDACALFQEVIRAIIDKPYVVPEVYERTPEHGADRLHSLATTYQRFGMHEEALKYHAQAMALDPKNPDPLLHHARAQALSGHIAEALDEWDAALAALPPDDAERRSAIWFNRGTLLVLMSQHAEAEAAFAQSLALMATRHDAWHCRADNELGWGVEEVRAGHIAEARTHLRRGISFVRQAIAYMPSSPPRTFDSHHLLVELEEELARLDG